MIIENNLDKLILGEAKLVLKKIPENSIDLVITSPPYWNAVEYDKKNTNLSYEDYLNNLVLIFKECFRVLRPNGKIAINTPVMPIPQEIIKQDVNGFLFNIGDIDSLIKKINLILNKKNLTNSILLNANKNLEKFSKKKIISDYKSIIDPVL